MKPVIICGGVGTKMWPESRQKMPKHFLPLFGGKSLFEKNYELLRKGFEPEDIYVSTNVSQAEIVKKLVPDIPAENYILEPELRNHGPATGLIAATLLAKFPDEPFMLVQADVLREPAEKFLETIKVMDELIRKEGKLVTGGIRPKYAVMGVDYLIRKQEESVFEGVKVYKMDKWMWRDSKERAEGYVKNGLAYLHANHYAWTPRLMMEAIKKYRMDWYEPLMNIVEGKPIAQEYAKMPKGPIEEWTQYELVSGFVVELPFEWIDFGTWESVAKYLIEKGMYKLENGQEIEAEDNFVRVSKGKYVALVGVKNLVVVETADALLVVDKSQSGKVGMVVEKLKEEGRGELL